MSENKGIGKRLKEARAKAGLTQEQACKQAGIPKTQTLSTYERGTSTPRLDALMDLVKLYGVTADWVLFGNERVSEEERRKSPAEYLAQLVESVDHLGLLLNAYDDKGDEVVSIEMNCSKYREMPDFASSWKSFRSLLDENKIDSEDYKMLIQHKLPQQLSEKTPEPDPCEAAAANNQIPF